VHSYRTEQKHSRQLSMVAMVMTLPYIKFWCIAYIAAINNLCLK